ncbi:hypothetical protein SAMN05444359_11123 [Neolewinella agarilytica]|uniref:Glycosyltransferase n=1 Tax=Neolewinella agarilytica TaxID=478744 RepID=A0A1H9GMC6_9BACT|nr:hypothetical protein SAMN05444359_11123 [Neolewinella agarilytica]
MIGKIYLRVRQGWNPWRKMLSLIVKRRQLIVKAARFERQEGIIVSFTAIPERVSQLKYTILSILNGDEIPERIVLYVSEKTKKSIREQQDKVLNELLLIGYLEIREVKDVGPHTKLIYALEDFPGKAVVVCDDDIVYPPYWFHAIRARYHEVKGQQMVVAQRAHRVTYYPDGAIKPYADWEKEVPTVQGKAVIGKDLFPTGTGGVLFPPGSMPELTTTVSEFKELAPKADDIWFWFCALLNGNTFTLTDVKYQYEDAPEIPNYKSPNLYYDNVGGSANDDQFQLCQNYFKQKHNLQV